MRESEMVSSSGTSLLVQSELYEPMLYYGAMSRIAIEYVSDILLSKHARFFGNNIRKTVRVLAKSLYDSSACQRSLSWNMPIFLGDVSSEKDVVVAFYRQYRINVMYHQYKQFRCKQVSADDILTLEKKRADAKRRSDNLAKYIATKYVEFEQMKRNIDKYVSYSKVIAPKGSLERIEHYLESNYYKKRELPHSLKKKILLAATLEDEISRLECSKQKQDSLIAVEVPNKIVELRDFKPCEFEHHPDCPIGLVILGNHEYIDFFDVDEAVKFYKDALEPLGYIVLQNEYVEDDNVVIYGGSGFAKYSESFNANNVPCCMAMIKNRAYEIEQTTLFENGYKTAKKHAIDAGKCFICASHYPVESCLGKFDREAVYFTGHTHINERVRTEEKTLYADNQVGYHKNGKFDGVIQFKLATTDSVTNPYDSFEDGCYQTTPEAYLQFYDYIGEYVGEGTLIRKRCKTGELYVIKSRGYYGFFVMSSSGISIVNGGKTKRIALSKNIDWIYDNFNIVINKYLTVLEPLRMMQVQISRELKQLGFSGNIHGLIVDIDFCNHIMMNPFNGSVEFYYSPVWGIIQQFNSFQKQLEFMNDMGLLEGKRVTPECNALATCCSNTLASVENNDVVDEMIAVSRTTGAYGVSRIVNPLQRLFTGHVLRDFDVRLIEIGNEGATGRKLSMCGRVYRDENCQEYLVVRDDLGEFVILLDRDGKESTITVLKLRALTHGKGMWLTRCLDETLAKYSGTCLPKAWREALQHIKSKEEKK